MSRSPSKEAARAAFQLAAREVENIADKSVPAEERESRKRQLIRGPKKFRVFVAISRSRSDKIGTWISMVLQLPRQSFNGALAKDVNRFGGSACDGQAKSATP